MSPLNQPGKYICISHWAVAHESFCYNELLSFWGTTGLFIVFAARGIRWVSCPKSLLLHKPVYSYMLVFYGALLVLNKQPDELASYFPVYQPLSAWSPSTIIRQVAVYKAEVNQECWVTQEPLICWQISSLSVWTSLAPVDVGNFEVPLLIEGCHYALWGGRLSEVWQQCSLLWSPWQLSSHVCEGAAPGDLFEQQPRFLEFPDVLQNNFQQQWGWSWSSAELTWVAYASVRSPSQKTKHIWETPYSFENTRDTMP